MCFPTPDHDVQLAYDVAEEGTCSQMHEPSEGNNSTIVTRMQRSPRQRSLSVMQTSPYFNIDHALRMGKRKMKIVYSSRKQLRKMSKHITEEQKLQEMGATTLELKMLKTIIHIVHPTTECEEQEPTLLNPCTEVQIHITCVFG